MTDPFPFTPLDEADDDEPAGRSTRTLVLAGGVVAALALAASSLLFLGGGDDTLTPVALPTRAARPAIVAKAPVKAPARTPVKAPAKVVRKLPVPFDEDLGRNPFRALYVEPVAAAGPASDPTVPGVTSLGPATTGGTTTTTPTSTGGTTTTPTTTGTTTGTTTPTTSGTGTTTGSTGTGSTGTGAAAPTRPTAPTAREYVLVLRRVYGAGRDLTAEFTIDGRRQVARVGIRFGPTSEIRLLDLQPGPKAGQWTSVLQVGDGEPFDAVTGDRVSVR